MKMPRVHHVQKDRMVLLWQLNDQMMYYCRYISSSMARLPLFDGFSYIKCVDRNIPLEHSIHPFVVKCCSSFFTNVTNFLFPLD